MKQKHVLLLLVCLAIFSCQKEKPYQIDRSVALLPPMGWNSWDCFGWTVNEAQVRANAEYVAKNLKHLGYEYIVIDQNWFANAKDSDFDAFVHETISTKPDYHVNQFGVLQPDTVKFPSARGGKGFKPLADYIHSLGLKMGLHQLRGMPWKATVGNRTIKGTNLLCSAVAQPDSGCVWYDGFYGVDAKKEGALDYYNSVYKQFADWGIDYIKVDDVVNVPDLENISQAVTNSGRPMVLSVVPENIPMDVLKRNVHMARTGFDFWDVWQMLKVGFPVAAKAVQDQEPGFWPDADMLPIGKIGIGLSYKGPDPRISNFTHPELRVLMGIMYIARMPLMIGAHLPETDQFTIDLIKNEEALEVNRTAENPKQIKFKNAVIIWKADKKGSKDKYLAYFNPWEAKKPVNMKVTWKDLGLDGKKYMVRNLWNKKDLGLYEDGFVDAIGPHDCGLYKISEK